MISIRLKVDTCVICGGPKYGPSTTPCNACDSGFWLKMWIDLTVEAALGTLGPWETWDERKAKGTYLYDAYDLPIGEIAIDGRRVRRRGSYLSNAKENDPYYRQRYEGLEAG